MLIFLSLTYFHLYGASRSIHSAASGTALLLFLAGQYSIVYACRVFSDCSSAEGHLGYLHVLVMVNSSVMNIGVHISFSE